MGSVRINEVALNQENHNAQDAVSIGDSPVSVTIRNAFDSTQNMYVGWNQQANPGNLLPPGTSVVYEMVGYDLAKNKLYINWGTGSSGGKGTITIMTEICN